MFTKCQYLHLPLFKSSTCTNLPPAQGNGTLNSSQGSSTQHRLQLTPSRTGLAYRSHGAPAPVMQRSISAPTGDPIRNLSLNLSPVQEDGEPLVLPNKTRDYVNEVLLFSDNNYHSYIWVKQQQQQQQQQQQNKTKQTKPFSWQFQSLDGI